MSRALPHLMLATHRIALGGLWRQPGRLDELPSPPRSVPDIQEQATQLCGGTSMGLGTGGWLLSGGEPTLRPDLLEILRSIRAIRMDGGAIWLRTDGLALVSPAVVSALQQSGLTGVRMPLHSGRADAHDWLVGLPGAARRVTRALTACVQQGLLAEVEITMTRPTLPYLVETVALAARLGARAVWIRRLRAQGAAERDFIALSPRLAQVRTPLEETVLLAEELGLHARVEGIPRCVSPGIAENLWGTAAAASEAEPCALCPGGSACGGVPVDYTARFGWGEIWRLLPTTPRSQVRLVVPADEPSRSVRLRMVRAARLRPDRVRLVDVAAHPEAGSLLRDALRLSVPTVEVSGRIDGLSALSDAALFRLRGLSRVDALATDPAAVPALRALLRRLPGDIATGVYGVVSSAAAVRAFRAAGVDALRLSPSGGEALRDLGGLGLSEVPPCLGGAAGEAVAVAEAPWTESTPLERGAVPTDSRGHFAPCPHASDCRWSARCPGLAEGWSAEGIAPDRTPEGG